MRKLMPLFLGLLFLFFFQLLTDFFESIYAFGLLVTRFTVEAASLLLIFAPVFLLFFRKGIKRPVLIGLVILALVARAVEPFLPLSGRLVFSSLGMAALLVYFPACLVERKAMDGASLASGLSIAVLLSVFLRALGSGSDWSLIHPLAGIFLALAVFVLLFYVDFDLQVGSEKASSSSFPRLAGLAVGIAGAFLMLYFAFISPTVIARWTGTSYLLIVAMLGVAWFLFSLLLSRPRFVRLLARGPVLAWNALFLISLVLTIGLHQVAFPADPSVYPLAAPAASPLALIPLLVMLLLSPVVLLDLVLFARASRAEHPEVSQLGGAFGLAALFFLVLVFLHALTTIYDYTPVIGPLFRDRFWLVYLLAGLGLSLPVLLLRQKEFDLPPHKQGFLVEGGLAVLFLGSVLAVWLTAPHPADARLSTELKVMTYNIQQSFDVNGHKNMDGQLAVIRKVNPDLLGLEESDTARLTNGNVDAVRYFADGMNMYSYYGPSTTTGTFGIALLSKYPIENPHTIFLYSTGEQTAAIQAQVTIAGRTTNVFVTHLGNDGPMPQLQDLLLQSAGLERLVIVGDFNFRPTTDQYHLVTGLLADAWLLRWPGGSHIPGANLSERIDYIFVSPDIQVI